MKVCEMRRALWQQAILTALLIAVQAVAAAESAPQELVSGDRSVALIELFSSEGCSSCPPADRWISTLRTHPKLWKEFAPIAFHVDYWNHIGWRDRFARAEYSNRQRRYASEGASRAVYTPGVFKNGQEWHGWRSGTGPISQPTKTVGVLSLHVDGQTIEARFCPTATYSSDLQLHIVVLGMNLNTRVRAGENKGRTLRHDFVALGNTSVVLQRSGSVYRATTRLPEITIQPDRRALTAWVSNIASQAPIQAVGGFLPSAASASPYGP